MKSDTTMIDDQTIPRLCDLKEEYLLQGKHDSIDVLNSFIELYLHGIIEIEFDKNGEPIASYNSSQRNSMLWDSKNKFSSMKDVN